MEYILAVLFSSNSILGGSTGVNLFYIFAAVLLLFYMGFRKKAFLQILTIIGGILAFTGLVWLIGMNRDFSASARFVLFLCVDIIVMIYIVRGRFKWSMLRFTLFTAGLHGVETVIALFMRKSALWGHYVYDDMVITKLQLFYAEPAVLCFVSGLLFIYFVYKSFTGGFSIKLILGCAVALTDMFFSVSLSGIVSCIVALITLLISHIIRNWKKIKKNPKNTIIWTGIFIVAGITTAIIFKNTPIYYNRITDTLQGKDVSFTYTVSSPFMQFVKDFTETKGRGLGIGASPDTFNSFVRLMSEGGILGILVVLGIIAGLLILVYKFGGVLDNALFVYIIMYQFVAGEFTNPVTWFIYGWLIADCLDYRNLRREKQNTKEQYGEDLPITVAIIGAKGLANYGGYETFTDKLTEYHSENKKIRYIVACKGNHHGCMDEKKLKGAKTLDSRSFVYHNAYCYKVNVPKIGPAQAIIYDILAARHALAYFKKHKIEKPVLYILTCRIGPVIGWIARAMHDIGGVYYLNPDGHEFLRANWSPAVRRYWKISEQLMVKHADLVICDSKNIETYIKASYEQYNPKTTFIPYGAEEEKSKLSDNDTQFMKWMQEKEVSPKKYYLIVGRLVPENNYETMIREFMASDTEKDLVMITNDNPYLIDSLEEKYQFSKDKRIKFVGPVYDAELLRKIRENAFAYLHGHEVGGTNPSLLEALSSTEVNLLYDVGFNRECAESAALYWTKEEGDLCQLIKATESMSEEERELLDKESSKRIHKEYNWQRIADKYEQIWKKSAVRR